VKSFLRQLKFEILNIIRSKFLMIIGILLLAAAIAMPVIDFAASRKKPDGAIDRPIPMPMNGSVSVKSARVGIPVLPGPDMGNRDSITIDGITINSDNPFYWNIYHLVQEKEYVENDRERFSSPEALDLYLSLMDAEIQHHLKFAMHITDYRDYRYDLNWRGQESIYDKFTFENADVSEDALLEVLQQRRGMDPEYLRSKYLDLPPEEKLAALDRIEGELAELYSILENNDFPLYVDYRIRMESKTIEDLKEQIAKQEQEIINNPSQEDIINNIIEDLKRQIALIEENTIPILQLRLERNIIPGEDTWQNSALSEIENLRNQLSYTEIVSEEEFNQQPWLAQQYGTYQKYVDAMQAQIDEMNNNIIIAEKSIDSDKPDMKFVSDGPRNRTVRFLSYSVFIALFAVLLGGWLMASEFQQGTIRLLMIRPKTRTKILAAKFLSALIISVVIYISGSLLNALTNGICFGFSDFAYPNYTLAGEIGFLAYYLPKMLACIVPVIFSYAFAFMLSVLIRNVAVSIAVPIAGFIANTIFMPILAYTGSANWIAYTPLPYMQLSSFFIQYSVMQEFIRRGVPLNLTYGIILLLGLSVLFIGTAVYVFRKRDIVN
jgi:ABC-2 type transport system permease protein